MGSVTIATVHRQFFAFTRYSNQTIAVHARCPDVKSFTVDQVITWETNQCTLTREGVINVRTKKRINNGLVMSL